LDLQLRSRHPLQQIQEEFMGIPIAVDLRSAAKKSMQATGPQVLANNSASKTGFTEKHFFDSHDFLDVPGAVRKVLANGAKVTVFSQGDAASSILYIQEGAVKLMVVNEAGKEAVVAILGPGDFLGEECLAGQSLRVNTAETITRSTILVIEKREMIRLLQAQKTLAEQFIQYTFSRYIRVEEDLIDQLFNSSEKRLVRTLLLLARYGKQDKSEITVPRISQETLAEMIGTTRSRVNIFMNKFKEMGFIEYGVKQRGLQINMSLLSTMLED
jgi:CRP/FNR family transcriptional regulator, cyclic AMP receptor protein